LASLEVSPGYRVLQAKGASLQLQVNAVFSDGSKEDVTGMALFSSNDDGVLKVSRSGLITAEGGSGDAAIMVRYAGKFAAPVYGATMFKPVPPAPGRATNLVDREVYAKLDALRIQPSPQCT